MGIEDLAGLIAEYHDEPVGFCNDILGFAPSPQQAEIAYAVANHRRTTVRSGHSIGKTRIEAGLAWWFLTTRIKSIIPATAPTSHQLYDILWKELIFLKGCLPKPIGNLFDYSSERIWFRGYKEEWFLQAVTSRKENPDALQGFHNEEGGLFFLCEEASGIPDVSFEPIEGAITGPEDRMLLCGNPTKTGGYFYDSHNAHADEYCALRFSSLDSPFYKNEVADSLARRYGKDSSIYRVRVLGEFPKAEADQLLSYEALEECVDLDVTKLVPRVWGVDVARYGDDSTVLAIRHGQKVLPLKRRRGMNGPEVARWVAGEYRATPDKDKPAVILIDTNGVGSAVFDYLLERRYPVEPAMASWNAIDRMTYGNAKAETYFTFASDVKERRVSLPSVDEFGDPENELIAQGASIKYYLKERGNGTLRSEGLYIESKDDRKRKGLPSPDALEAVVMTYYYQYVGRIGDTDEEAGDIQPLTLEDHTNYYDYDEYGRGEADPFDNGAYMDGPIWFRHS